LVERQLPKLEVAGSKPVVRSVLAFQHVSTLRPTGFARQHFSFLVVGSSLVLDRKSFATAKASP
jgi:hypothetical protein